MRSRVVIGFMVFASLCLASWVGAQQPAAVPQEAIYSIKFLCGFESEPTPSLFPSPSEPPVKPGNYATAVNIINFHTFAVHICKVAVVANPESCSEPNPPEGNACNTFLGIRSGISLAPEQTFEVDCNDIVNLFGGPSSALPSFIKGFVEIVVLPQTGLSLSNPLNVTAVYSAQQCVTPTGKPCTNQNPLFPGGVRVVPETSTLTEPSFCGLD
jgi:hypothetical protein